MDRTEAIDLYKKLKHLDETSNIVLMPMLLSRANPNNIFFRRYNFFRWLLSVMMDLVEQNKLVVAKEIRDFLRKHGAL